MISVIVPVYNEEGNIRNLHERIVKALAPVKEEWEIIFVNDGSSDGTEEIAKSLRPLKLVTLQRNHGQTPAIDTGIFVSRGETIVLIDADLQNDPADIPSFVAKVNEGYDMVIGWRQARQDHWTRVVFSKVANKIARTLLDIQVHDFGCGLKAYRSRLIKDFRLWGEAQVFLPAIAKQRGARIYELPISHYAREAGAAKVRISKMIRGVFDLLGIVFFVRYASRPLRFFGGWGLGSLVLAFAAFAVAIALRLGRVLNFSDTPLPIVGTLFAILGVMLFMMGLLAEMMLRMHYSVTNSSPYFIREIHEAK